MKNDYKRVSEALADSDNFEIKVNVGDWDTNIEFVYITAKNQNDFKWKCKLNEFSIDILLKSLEYGIGAKHLRDYERIERKKLLLELKTFTREKKLDKLLGFLDN